MEKIGFIFAIGAAVTWGLSYAIDQKILASISPALLLFVSSLLTAVIMLPYLFFRSESIRVLQSAGKSTIALIILEVLLTALANFFIFSGIKSLNASTASIIEIAYPFFVVLFSFILFRSAPNIYFFIGGILVFVGSFIIIKFA